MGIARDHGVSERVHMLGDVRMELPRWRNACDVFAMPNRDIGGDTEGFGLVYLEANACGKPVVAGRAGGTASAVEESHNGLQVEGERVAVVEEGLADLLAHPEKAQRMGR